MRETYEVSGQPGSSISTVRVEFLGAHARIKIWNRGGLTGELVVNATDADEFVSRLTDTRRVSWSRLDEVV